MSSIEFCKKQVIVGCSDRESRLGIVIISREGFSLSALNPGSKKVCGVSLKIFRINEEIEFLPRSLIQEDVNTQFVDSLVDFIFGHARVNQRKVDEE